MPDLIGKTLGEYQIVEQIGKGGMATIYKAYQPSLSRDVAIKVLPPYYAEQDETFLTRFKNEARAIAKLRHPNILMVMSSGEQEGLAYIVMEYVEAGTLKDRMESPLSLQDINLLIGQVASALDYAHGEGVVHRDVKPSNILLPKPDWALLTDFGLARMVGGTQVTKSGMTVGTPAYMSPEQGSGGKIDHRTDIYSLGVILYEMAVGEVPYTAETPMAVVVKHIVDPLPVPRAKKPDIPEALQRVILKALAKDPDTRFQKAGELADALGKVASGKEEAVTILGPMETAEVSQQPEPPVQAAPTPPTAEKPKKRLPWLIIGIAAAVVAIGLLAAGVLYGGYTLYQEYFGSTAQVEVAPTEEEMSEDKFEVTEHTPVPLPTRGGASSPTPMLEEPEFPSGTVLFEDDFSDPTSGWDTGGDEYGFTDYLEDTYHIQVIGAEYYWLATPYQYFGDVRIEVDTLLYDGGENNSFGIICGYRGMENYIEVLISSDGYYGMGQFIDGEYISVSGDFRFTDAINLDGALNHMQVDCVGDTVSLFVNGSFVDSWSGIEIGRGDIGLTAAFYDDEGFTEIEFDNFIVYAP